MHNVYEQIRKFSMYLLRSEALTPVPPPQTDFPISYPLSRLEGPHGSGHPDPDFKLPSPQHNQLPCNRSTSRKNVPCQGVQDNRR
jgi:hypothetical protein